MKKRPNEIETKSFGSVRIARVRCKVWMTIKGDTMLAFTQRVSLTPAEAERLASMLNGVAKEARSMEIRRNIRKYTNWVFDDEKVQEQA